MNGPWDITINTDTGHVYVSTNHDGIIHLNENGQFIKKVRCRSCYGIVYNNNRIITSHFVDVIIRDTDLKQISKFGGGVGLNGADGISCDGHGNIYVTDGKNHRVYIFTSEGDYIGLFDVGHSPEWILLTKPIIHMHGDVLVSEYHQEAMNDHNGSWYDDISVVNVYTMTGEYIRRLGQMDDATKLVWPRGMCQDMYGNILVADDGDKTIKVYNELYEHRYTIKDPGDAFGDLYGITITKDGTIIVTDCDHDKIHFLQASLTRQT